MSESSDRDRLTRVEERLSATQDVVKSLASLPAEFAVQRAEQENLEKDLAKGFDAIRAELVEIKADAIARVKERRTMLFALLIAVVGLCGNFVAQIWHLGGHG